MGCRLSVQVKPVARTSISYRSKRINTNKNEVKATDLEIILFYDHIRELFVVYLSELSKQNELYLYEAVENLKNVEFLSVHAEFRKWFRTSFLQNSENIEHLEIKTESKIFLHSLRHIDESMVTNELIRTLGRVQLEVVHTLDSLVRGFSSSQLFRDRIYYDPPTLLSASASNQSPKGKTTVLLVTANVLFGKILSQLLHQNLRCDVIFVTKGTSATPYLMSRNLDAVLICPELPDKGGIVVIQEFIRLEDMCRTKIPLYVRPLLVCLMSREVPAIRDGATAAGFNAFLNIPCSLRECERVLPAKTISSKINQRIGTLVANLNVSQRIGAIKPHPEDDYDTSTVGGNNENDAAI